MALKWCSVLTFCLLFRYYIMDEGDENGLAYVRKGWAMMLVSRLFNRFLAFLSEFMRALGTLVAAVGLEDFLVRRVVFSEDGVFHGIITDIKLGLPSRIWVVTDNLGQKLQIPLEHIVAIGYSRAIIASLISTGFNSIDAEAGESLVAKES